MKEEKFVTPYLVQRMNYRKNPVDEFSFDGLFNLDYMGSSEFEWGALPKALRKMRDNIDGYEVVVFGDIVNQNKEPLSIVCRKDSGDDYRKHINSMIGGDWRGKELAKFAPHVTGKGFAGKKADEYDLDIQAWWDLDNLVIFTFGKENAENTVKAIRRTVFSLER